MVKLDKVRNNALIEYRKYFYDKGFKLSNLHPSTIEFWRKEFIYVNKKGEESKHLILVAFGESFPYMHPSVLCDANEQFINESRHQNAIFEDATMLCLWHENDWDVYTTPETFYKRIEEWFDHSYNDSWEEKDRLADLDLHFEPNNILAINGDDWNNYNFDNGFGYFKYIELKYRDYSQCLYVYNPKDGVSQGGIYIPPSSEYQECTNPLLKEFHYFKQDRNNTYDGIWFYFNQEPKPCRSFEELIAQIKNLSQLDDSLIDDEINKIRAFKSIFVVLSVIYDDNKGNRQWVHFKINKSDLKMTAFKTCKCDKTSLNLRISHLKTKIQDKSVAVFGIGAIGSIVADSLGKHGLKKLILLDKDKLEPSNIIRHSLGATFIGIDKSLAMKLKIDNHSLGFTEVLNYGEDCNNIEKIKQIIDDVDIVVDCTANKNFSFLLNHICIEANKIAVYITSQRKAAIGQIRVVRPNIDPCLCCYEAKDGIIDNHEKYNYPHIPKGKDDEIILGCGEVTYPAVAADIDMIADWGVKIVLWLLQDKFKYNHCLIINEIIDNPPDYLMEIGHQFRTFEKVKGCDICND
jgi:molybdopterin/thiamine biosynthesis adenylyltransferase